MDDSKLQEGGMGSGRKMGFLTALTEAKQTASVILMFPAAL